jgi:hypothetical protein
LQLFVVDKVDVGLANATVGMKRLNETMKQFAEAISGGLTASVDGKTYGMKMLRQCYDDKPGGCDNATVIADGPAVYPTVYPTPTSRPSLAPSHCSQALPVLIGTFMALLMITFL